MTDTPPDWVLIEAAKRGKMLHLGSDMLRIDYATDKTFRALCDMILKHEQPPVDRKLLCAREACGLEYTSHSGGYIHGEYDDCAEVLIAISAIELWEEGFGK